ncbi:MAG: gluconate 2-dehydrogenase subunit 3 family protein [Bryobacterales bacterium]|nr:gluconate 2-dehydrogenase subunit 3 family protein [Bryobacterales bacterium]MDE0624496.1 gluconate 2-dehydrogenase subunit 3 family protein [Bryobacterales bacterium]
MPQTTRRQALVSIAAGLSVRTLPAQDAYEPVTFSAEEFDLLGIVVDMILPASDTPGAREVGVHAMIDEDLAKRSDPLGTLRNGLAALRADGFADMDMPERVAVLTRFEAGSGADKDFFETVKGLTIDAYYSTEVGLVQELGYQGNTYLDKFPGCTHDHKLEDAD